MKVHSFIPVYHIFDLPSYQGVLILRPTQFRFPGVQPKQSAAKDVEKEI